MEKRINRPSHVDDYSNIELFELRTLFPPIGKGESASSTFEMSTMEKT